MRWKSADLLIPDLSSSTDLLSPDLKIVLGRSLIRASPNIYRKRTNWRQTGDKVGPYLSGFDVHLLRGAVLWSRGFYKTTKIRSNRKVFKTTLGSCRQFSPMVGCIAINSARIQGPYIDRRWKTADLQRPAVRSCIIQVYGIFSDKLRIHEAQCLA